MSPKSSFSLLERRCAPGCDGVAPSTLEVVRGHRHALQSRGVRCARMVLSFVALLHPGSSRTEVGAAIAEHGRSLRVGVSSRLSVVRGA